MRAKQWLRESRFIQPYLQRRRILAWIRNEFPLPPPADFKQLAVLYYSLAYKHDVLIETGTYFGDMIWAQKDFFETIYSIELSETLFAKAKLKFRKFDHIKLLQGDSSFRLQDVIPLLDHGALFWLDGHYSGGVTAKGTKVSPVYEELKHIFGSPFPHTILIDDARLFNGEDDYPTLTELVQFIRKNSPYSIKVENDIIVLTQPISV